MNKPRASTSIKVDRELTAQRYADGTYQHPRKFSAVHQNGKEYLFGVDKRERYYQVYRRDGMKCVKCGMYLNIEDFEPDHIAKNFGEPRWDNLDNLRTLCSLCHRTGKDAKHA